MSVTVMLGGSADEISPAIQTAIQLTKRFGSSLTGLCALPDPATTAVYIVGAETVMLGASAIASMKEAQDSLAETLSLAFSEQSNLAGPWLKAQFERQTGSVALHGAVRASLADAFILPKQSTHSAHSLNPAFEHVLMEAKLPMILAPKQTRESDTCLIAWDGSPLAARAVKAHMPLIATFKTVIVAEQAEKVRHQWAPACEDATARLIEILRDQRLDVQTISLQGNVSEGLLAASADHNVSMIVMGAYGHARIGQMLFGGTTSKMLRSDDAPALALCH